MNKILAPCSQTSLHPINHYRHHISTGLTGEQVANPLANISPSAVQLLIWTAGTGGTITARSTVEIRNRCYDPRIHIESYEGTHDDSRSPAEHLANIRDVFGINMSDLAYILHVTRPTVYAWLSGQEPKEDAVRRIQQISSLADAFARANILRLDKLVHRPVFNGRSLLEMLAANKDPIVILPTLKAIGDKEAQTRRKPKGSGKHLRTLEDVFAEYSTPID